MTLAAWDGRTMGISGPPIYGEHRFTSSRIFPLVVYTGFVHGVGRECTRVANILPHYLLAQRCRIGKPVCQELSKIYSYSLYPPLIL